MPGDNRRISGPENVLSPSLYRTETKKLDLINEDNLRQDGRSSGELRLLSLKVGVITQATGSAYYEVGKTKITCSVYGPREVFRKQDFSIKGQLYCEFKYAPYSCKFHHPHQPTNEEKDISNTICEALESVVLLHKFPKAKVDIFIMVLEDDGGVLSGSITCAGAALANAGIEMYDLVVGYSLRQFGPHSLIDPISEEEVLEENGSDKNNGRITLGLMPSYHQVILLLQDGELQTNVVSKGIRLLMDACQKLYPVVQQSLIESIREKEPENTSASQQ